MKTFMTVLWMGLSCSKLVRCSILALFTLLPIGTGLFALAGGMSHGGVPVVTLITGLTMKFGDLSPITLWGHIMIILIGFSVAIADQIIRLVAPDNRRGDNS